MKIATKLNIGDEIFFMVDNKVRSEKIQSIRTETRLEDMGTIR